MGLSILDKIRLLKQLNKTANAVEGAVKMKDSTKVFLAIVTGIGGFLQIPVIQNAVVTFLTAHPGISAVLAALTTVLALIHNPVAASNTTSASSAITKNMGMILLILSFGMLLTPTVHAQTPSPAPVTNSAATFTGSADAVAFRYNGQWGVGSLTTESLDFIDLGKTKSNHVFVEGRELVASTAGLNVYTGGVAIQPDLTNLLKKTNVSTANLSISFNVGAGAGIPASGGSHISFITGGGVRYKATSALTWTALQAQYVRYGSKNSAAISTGLAFAFGK